ncbi:diacylglycerol/lipid kinase family protein [Adlercreutzia murintestinalis]|uniref:diacylglycerol/lipid kinase family protein n=1 Tax=Adlercreutzia murintestinalis TaxID=2941325 RepID=UPI00203BD37F|nr:diacylglycerol kinase family protein [Adlercreutzia murintestinalis]
MKLLVINNVASGLGDLSVFDFCRTFAQDGDEIVVRTTNGRTDIRTLLGDADTFDCVVAAGGDGTVTTVASMLADTGIPVLPYPAGTANLLSANLFSPTDIHELVRMTRRGRTMSFDLGEIELSDGQRFGFTLMAGAGYDAAIMKSAEQTKHLFGPMAYFTSAFANATPQHSTFDLTIDGEHIHTDGVGVLIINFSKIQFDISVVHENMPRDGIFDIVVFHTKDAFGLIPALFAAILDRTGEFPARTEAFELFQGSEVEVVATPPLVVEYDGEVTGTTTPFTVRMLPCAATFVVSDECLRAYS